MTADRQLVTYADMLDGAKVDPLTNWESWPQVSVQPLAWRGDPLGYVVIFQSVGAVPMFAGFNAPGELCSPSPRNTLAHAAEDIGDAIIAAVILQADDPIDTPQPPVITELDGGIRIIDDVIVDYPTAGELLVRMVDGGGALALHHDDPYWDADEGDMQYFPVGPVCAKPLPSSALATGDRLTD